MNQFSCDGVFQDQSLMIVLPKSQCRILKSDNHLSKFFSEFGEGYYDWCCNIKSMKGHIKEEKSTNYFESIIINELIDIISF